MDKVKIILDNQGIAYEYVLNYLPTFSGVHIFKGGSFKRGRDGKFKAVMKCGWDSFEIFYKDVEIKIEYGKVGDPKGTTYGVQVYDELILEIDLEMNGLNMKEGKNILQQFLEDAREHSMEKEEGKITTKVLKKGYWTTLSKLPKRSLETIYLDCKNDIIDDLSDFIKNEEEYKKYGIPYKRNYLFEGLPGTGKSSFIFAIASYLERDIYMISFSREMEDADLMMAITNIPDNVILVLEDIDSLFVGRRSNEAVAMNISFSSILNLLDGCAIKHGMITFMTTNYVDRLDSALVRQGRVDKRIRFGTLCERQVEEMFGRFFPEQKGNFGKLWEKLKKKEITTSVLQEWFFRNRGCGNILEHMGKLDVLINKKEKNSHMYI